MNGRFLMLFKRHGKPEGEIYDTVRYQSLEQCCEAGLAAIAYREGEPLFVLSSAKGEFLWDATDAKCEFREFAQENGVIK